MVLLYAVIASVAKQSRDLSDIVWIAASLTLLAMTVKWSIYHLALPLAGMATINKPPTN